MKNWVDQKYRLQYRPLIGVLATLNVGEMAHLAEPCLFWSRKGTGNSLNGRTARSD